MDRLLARWNIDAQQVFMYLFAIVTLASIFASIRYQIQVISFIPFGVLVAYLCVVDFPKVFYLLLLSLPFSMELYLPGGLATDLPSEPLVLILMTVGVLYFFKNLSSIRYAFPAHPLTLLLGLHFFWTFICAITAADPFVSTKFLLAKFWYIAVYFFMAGLLLKDKDSFRKMIWCVSVPLAITIIYVLIQHAGDGFSFDRANAAVVPFYRNHVNYAATLSLFAPFIWYLKSYYSRFSFKWTVLWGILILVLLGITFAYTRAAYLALFAAIGAYWIIRFRLIKMVLVAALLGSILLTYNLLNNNRYIDYAPDFEKTISHKQFDNLVAATTKGEDVSLMERFYRWIAGVYMIKDRMIFGFGPGNFHGFYKEYTVRQFETYVSDNPEKSGIHSYYLMLGVEQGIPGIVFFVLILFYFLYRIEIVYHREKDPFIANIIMATFMCIVVIALLLIINDLIETDKVGSFFFISLAILINIDIKQSKIA